MKNEMLCSVTKTEEVQHNGFQCSICSRNAVYKTFCEDHFCVSVEVSVKETISRFSMFVPGDKILVAYSGGKDSTVLLFILQKLGLSVEAITLNAYIGCYSKENVRNATQFCETYKIPLHHISFREEFGYSLCYLRTLLQQKGETLKSCSICGVLRRYLLNKRAREMNATKIAFGHNLDDEVQVILMNFLKGNVEMAARIGPVNGLVKDNRFVQRVKPLYFVTEQEITLYSKIKKFPVHYGACPCSVDSYRYFIRTLIKNYESLYSGKRNIVELFLKLSPLLKEEFAMQEGPRQCSQCSEPSSGALCRACEIISLLTHPTVT